MSFDEEYPTAITSCLTERPSVDDVAGIQGARRQPSLYGRMLLSVVTRAIAQRVSPAITSRSFSGIANGSSGITSS